MGGIVEDLPRIIFWDFFRILWETWRIWRFQREFGRFIEIFGNQNILLPLFRDSTKFQKIRSTYCKLLPSSKNHNGIAEKSKDCSAQLNYFFYLHRYKNILLRCSNPNTRKVRILQAGLVFWFKVLLHSHFTAIAVECFFVGWSFQPVTPYTSSVSSTRIGDLVKEKSLSLSNAAIHNQHSTFLW